MWGRRTVKYLGTDKDSQVRLIDFENPVSNILRVTTEAKFKVGRESRRYDIVLWVNGLPVVVGEMKTPVGAAISWLNGATDIHNAYERKTPEFFVPNVLSVAQLVFNNRCHHASGPPQRSSFR
jgi:type I restriction enzyme R subunit